MKKIILGLAIAGLTVFSCKKADDDGNQPDRVNFKVTIENVVTPQPYFQSGLAAIPVGETAPGPIFPGGVYEFTFNAGPKVVPPDAGTRLSFVTMFVQSNDLFLAPAGEGIKLFNDDGTPVTGDVTDQLLLWDAGTEVNEMTGGPNQKPQQDPAAEDQGEDENGVVTEIEGNSDGVNTLPPVSEVAKVTLSVVNGTEFTVRIENVSTMMTIATPAKGAGTTAPVPMSPVVYVVHTADNPLFTEGEAASEGIENIAEDGFAMVEADRVAAATGLIVPMSPGVYAVHENGTTPFFMDGVEDFGEGLEGIAEDGAAATLGEALNAKSELSASGVFNTPVGAGEPGPIGPGGSYSFSISAVRGDYLSLTTMMVQSNDWIYTFPEGGIALFNGDDAISGDFSAQIELYDVGTEADEYAGAGLNQVIRQGAANTGPVDTNTLVREIIAPIANVPANTDVIKVTIEPMN